jgi:hypothetical protein
VMEILDIRKGELAWYGMNLIMHSLSHLDLSPATIDTELQKGFQKDLDTMFRGYEKTIVGFESSNAAM